MIYKIGTNTEKSCSFRKNSISKILNYSQPLTEESINWQASYSASKQHPSWAK